MNESGIPGNDLVPVLYQELRKLARSRMARLAHGQTLQPTDLVHEVYLRLSKGSEVDWNGRAHYFGAAAQAMRQILVERARQKLSRKRGGDLVRVDITITLADERRMSDTEMLALHQALEQLQTDHPRKAEVVLLRYFSGLTVDEIAGMLALTTRTIERDCKFALAWLEMRLQPRQ